MSDQQPRIRSVEVDLDANTIRLELMPAGSDTDIARSPESVTLDVGTGGRLIGVEMAAGYIEVMPPEPETEHLIRSSTAEATIERHSDNAAMTAIAIPRRGAGYELTYPSGNQ